MRMIAAVVMVCALTPTQAQETGPIKLTLHPTPPTSTALKYRLLPELRDMQTGNAAVHYLRAMAPELASQSFRKESQERLDQILETPADKLRGADMSTAINRSSLGFIEDGSRRTSCDWEMIERAKRDGIAMLLPDLQAMRSLARQSAARARVAIADGKFDDAHRDLRTTLALGRHVADGVTLIQGLVGIAVAAQSLNQIDAWIGQPGAPSLYWPLTDLPTPFIDLRKSFEGERFFMESSVPNMRDAKPGRFRLDRERFEQFLKLAGSEPNGQESVELFRHSDKNVAAAREYLKKRGWSDEQLNALPVLDAVVLHQVTEYDRIYEEMIKVFNLPVPMALELNARIAKELAPGPDRPIGSTMAGLMLPAFEKVVLARLRLDRRIAALRTIEAIRLHVTEKGKLPERLEDITVVPLPTDPLTGKPFEYRREGAAARLIMSAPPPIPKTTGHSIEYVLTTP